MKREGGFGQALIPTKRTHGVRCWQSDVRGCYVEGGELRVGPEDPQIIPPLGGRGLPLERVGGVIPLRLTSIEILVYGSCVHFLEGGGGVGGVVDLANTDVHFPHPVGRHDSNKELTIFKAERRWMAR